MNKEIKKFLQFNGKKIYFISAEGVWWIAIKPICEALGVNYERQRQNLQEHKILGQLPTAQQVVGADARLRKMVCLPEFFVYGWIFTIQSASPALEEYQWKCYELLYNYFNGTITERNSMLNVKTKAELELEEVEAELMETDPYKKLVQLKASIKDANKKLSALDKEYVLGQLPLWKTETKN